MREQIEIYDGGPPNWCETCRGAYCLECCDECVKRGFDNEP